MKFNQESVNFNTGYIMRYLIVLFVLSGWQSNLLAGEISLKRNLELSSGFSMALYQSVYSFQPGTAFEAAAKGDLSGSWDWQAGARLGLNHGDPEGFLRILAIPEFGAWNPAVGLELGLTNRARFDKGEQLLRETRQAMENDISPFYIAVHAAPFSFNLSQKLRVSCIEFQVGTHPGNTGRTTRLQIGLLSAGFKL